MCQKAPQLGSFFPQGQPLGKALFKFGHGPTGAQGIGPDFVYHGLFSDVPGYSGEHSTTAIPWGGRLASVWRSQVCRVVYQRA